MMISFVAFSILINYLLKKYRNLFDTIILGLSISSRCKLVIPTKQEEEKEETLEDKLFGGL